jgi:bifunctional ADP-heptose synthase (sugar kinase/adenylyltransferase)
MRSGHIRHLQNSRQKGDILLVTVTCDKHIQNGPGRPIFHERLRAENLAALSCVDFVAINYSPDAIKAISLIKPDLYMRGSEHKNATFVSPLP